MSGRSQKMRKQGEYPAALAKVVGRLRALKHGNPRAAQAEKASHC